MQPYLKFAFKGLVLLSILRSVSFVVCTLTREHCIQFYDEVFFRRLREPLDSKTSEVELTANIGNSWILFVQMISRWALGNYRKGIQYEMVTYVCVLLLTIYL